MADVAGVSVLTPTPPDARDDLAMVRVAVSDHPPERLGAQAWRHIQRGARIVAFDPGALAGEPGPGLTDPSGRVRAWVEPARSLARQLSVNGALFAQLQPGPPVSVRTDADDLLVSLFQTSRSWVLFATSLDGQARQIEASLPAGTPAALWISLLDGSGMSMLSRPAGPLWRTEMAPYGAHIYVIARTAGGGVP